MTHATATAEAPAAPPQAPRAFLLSHNDLPVGTLTRRATEWVFQYAPEFKAQDRIQPLVTFPRTDLTYRSSLLWSYFRNRIPSLEQLRVMRDSRLEGVDPNDHATLLARFGQRTIADPFTLTPLE